MKRAQKKSIEQTKNALFHARSGNGPLPYMSPQKFLTVEEALAAIEGPEFGEGDLDVVIAPLDVTVVSDEEGMDEDDLTESKSMLPDAAGEIEIHFNPVQSDDVPTNSVPKIKRCTKVKWSTKKAFFYILL